MKKITFLVLVLLVSFSVAAEELRLAALNGPTGIGMIKLFRDTPDLGDDYTVKTEVVGTPQLMMPLLIKGEVAAAVLPSNLASVLYNKGVPYRFGAVVGDGLLYVVGKKGSLDSVRDLAGKTLYATGKAATPDYLSQYIFEEIQSGLASQVKLDFSMKQSDLARALIEGVVDYALLPEPFISMVMMNNPDLGILLDWQKEYARLSGTGSNYPISVVVIHNEWIEDDPASVAAFLDSYQESITWVGNNVKEAATLVPGYGFTLKAPVVEKAIPNCNFVFREGDEARESMQSFLSILYELNPKSIGGSLPEDGYYYRR